MTGKASVLIAYLIALSCMMVMNAAQSAVFYISEVGTPGSLGTAGVVSPTNNFGADSAFTNHAGMTGLEHHSVVGGFQLVLPGMEFDPDLADAGGSDGGNAVMLPPYPACLRSGN